MASTVPSPDVSKRVIGLSLVEAMAVLTPGEDRERHVVLAESYKQHFQRARAEGRVEEPLFDGIPELLDALEADGWLLAVATGKSDRGLGQCLDCHGLSKRFISLQTADRHPSKPHPSMVQQAMADAGAAPETTIVIGDTASTWAWPSPPARRASAQAGAITKRTRCSKRGRSRSRTARSTCSHSCPARTDRRYG